MSQNDFQGFTLESFGVVYVLLLCFDLFFVGLYTFYRTENDYIPFTKKKSIERLWMYLSSWSFYLISPVYIGI